MTTGKHGAAALVLGAVLAAGIGAVTTATAQHAGPTIELNGDAHRQAFNTDRTHELYGVALMAFANGPENVDMAALRESARKVAVPQLMSLGVPEAEAREHIDYNISLFPQIIADDPGVLDSFENFLDAMVGPA